jgi:hypothetical protein
VNETFDAGDTSSGDSGFVGGSKGSLDDAVISEWDSASVDLTIASLVDELADGFSWWVTEGDEWLNDSDHVPGSLIKLDKDTVVQLSQSKKLHDLLWLWGKLVDTLNSDDECNLWLSFNEEVSGGFSGSSISN